MESGEHAHEHDGDEHSQSHEKAEHSQSHGKHSRGVDEDSINLRGAIIHVLGDFVQSIGVAIAGALIWWKQVSGLPSFKEPNSSLLTEVLNNALPRGLKHKGLID